MPAYFQTQIFRRPAATIAARTLFFIIATASFVGCETPQGAHDPHHADESSPESHAEEGAEKDIGQGVIGLNPQQLDAAGVTLGDVALRRLDAELRTTGEVDYEQDRVAHVGPRVDGRVVQVLARLGDQVVRGDVLAKIDSVELGEARSRYLAARSREELARASHEREQALFDQRISSKQKLEEAETEFREASAHRQGAAETLRLFGLKPDEIQWTSDAEADGGDCGLPTSGSLLEIVSPLDGRVVAKHVTLGELASPEDVLFTVADLDTVWVWIDVFERDLASVHEEDGVEVGVDSYPGRTFSGKVSYLASEVAPETRTVRARIDVPNPERLLRPGMFADVRLTDPHGDGGAPVPAVPASALVRRGDAHLVFIPLEDGGDGSRFRAHAVDIGRRAGGWVEVVSGLEVGQPIVVTGAFFLKSELSGAELGGGHSH